MLESAFKPVRLANVHGHLSAHPGDREAVAPWDFLDPREPELPLVVQLDVPDAPRRGTADEPGLNEWFAQVLDRYDRVLRPGIDIDRPTTMVMCLTYGFLFGSRSATRAVSEPIDWYGADTSLYEVAVEALVSRLTSFTGHLPSVEGSGPSHNRED